MTRIKSKICMTKLNSLGSQKVRLRRYLRHQLSGLRRDSNLDFHTLFKTSLTRCGQEIMVVMMKIQILKTGDLCKLSLPISLLSFSVNMETSKISKTFLTIHGQLLVMNGAYLQSHLSSLMVFRFQ